MYPSKCKKCNKDLFSYIYSIHLDSDYDEFEIQCPKCKTKYNVTVIDDPQFVLTPKTKEK